MIVEGFQEPGNLYSSDSLNIANSDHLLAVELDSDCQLPFHIYKGTTALATQRLRIVSYLDIPVRLQGLLLVFSDSNVLETTLPIDSILASMETETLYANASFDSRLLIFIGIVSDITS